jgi:cysteine dioxygenase
MFGETDSPHARPEPDHKSRSDLSLSGLVQTLRRDFTVITPAKMHDILERLTVHEAELAPYTLFSELRYARNLVYKDENFEVMVMCWRSGQRSSIHDHAGSLGGIKIIRGELTECLFTRAPNGMIKALHSNDHAPEKSRVEETALIHQISNLQAGDATAVSIHIYVPPLIRLNIYSLEDPAVRNILPQYFSLGAGI